jgi:DNA modification methylase
MRIQYWALSRIQPYDKNPRKNDAAVEAVARSIKEFGFRQPIVVDKDGVVIVGHTRLKAAIMLGLETAPVHVAADLAPAKVRALRIADNKTAELSDWDNDLLAGELRGLVEEDFDLSLLGFSPEDLAAAMAPRGNTGKGDPDNVPTPMAECASRMGDVWRLGAHRLMVGDSSKSADMARLLAGQKVHLVNTDPPYNVKVEPRSNNAIAAGLSSFESTHLQRSDVARNPSKATGSTGQMRAKDRPLANDFVTEDEFSRLLRAWFQNLSEALIPGGGFYIWGGRTNCANYPPAMVAAGLYFSQAVIWIKEHPVLTRKDMMGNHEWCFYGWKPGDPGADAPAPAPIDFGANFDAAFYGWKEGAAHRWFGPHNVPDTWHIKKVNPQSMVHLTEKPVELARRAMEYSSRPGENVLDIFGGSGSTLIAAEMMGRRAFLMELDRPYADVIIRRFIGFADPAQGDATVELVESTDGLTGPWEAVEAERKRRWAAEQAELAKSQEAAFASGARAGSGESNPESTKGT